MKVIPVIENTNLTFEKKFESLNVLSNIGQSLNKFSQMKILPGNSYYLYCTTCKKQSDRTAHQETHLKYPKVIILNLDRFKTGLGIAEGKRNHLINYEAKRKFGKHKYELIAVIIHDGNTPRHGHYTAYIKDFASQLWFYANDNIIRTVSAQEVINHKDAIGLVYKKKKKE